MTLIDSQNSNVRGTNIDVKELPATIVYMPHNKSVRDKYRFGVFRRMVGTYRINLMLVTRKSIRPTMYETKRNVLRSEKKIEIFAFKIGGIIYLRMFSNIFFLLMKETDRCTS